MTGMMSLRYIVTKPPIKCTKTTFWTFSRRYKPISYSKIRVKTKFMLRYVERVLYFCVLVLYVLLKNEQECITRFIIRFKNSQLRLEFLNLIVHDYEVFEWLQNLI